MHTFITAHHLVKEELEDLRPGLTKLYDRMAVSLALNYFIGDVILFYGIPSRFWSQIDRVSHPLHGHKVLTKHGYELWLESKNFLVRRAWKKGVFPIPFIHGIQMLYLVMRARLIDRKNSQDLAQIAVLATSRMWGIDEKLLEGKITTDVNIGPVPPAKTAVGRLTQAGAVGYSAVRHVDGRFKVVAKAWCWPLLVHELTKGVVELLSLHGLNSLSETGYRNVLDQTDQIEQEVWALQAGSEFWRRLLKSLPKGQEHSLSIMQLFRLPPRQFEIVADAIATNTEDAVALIEQLTDE